MRRKWLDDDDDDDDDNNLSSHINCGHMMWVRTHFSIPLSDD
jgi:hypothetical protein